MQSTEALGIADKAQIASPTTKLGVMSELEIGAGDVIGFAQLVKSSH